MKRTWFLILAVSVGLNAGLLVMALTGGRTAPDRPDGPPGPPGQGQGHFSEMLDVHLRRMTESLGLNDEQRAAIAAVHRDLLPKIGAQHRVLSDLRREIADDYERPGFTAEGFRALSIRISEAQARLDALVTEAMLGEAAVLTEEQRRAYAREMPWGRGGPQRSPPPGGKKKGR